MAGSPDVLLSAITLQLCGVQGHSNLELSTPKGGWKNMAEAKKHLCRFKRFLTLKVKKELAGEWPMSREKDRRYT